MQIFAPCNFPTPFSRGYWQIQLHRDARKALVVERLGSCAFTSVLARLVRAKFQLVVGFFPHSLVCWVGWGSLPFVSLVTVCNP